MATKIERKAPVAEAGSVENELDVLHPERHLSLGGRRLVVREYGHVEWLRLLPQAAPLVESIAALLESGREPTYEQALAIVAAHVDGLAPLIAQSADLTLPEFEQMPPDQGEVLLMTWWGVNGRFFVQRALNRVAVARAQARASDTGASTQPSSPTATTEPTSADTPSGS